MTQLKKFKTALKQAFKVNKLRRLEEESLSFTYTLINKETGEEYTAKIKYLLKNTYLLEIYKFDKLIVVKDNCKFKKEIIEYTALLTWIFKR